MDQVLRANLDLYEAGEYAAFSATVRPVAMSLVDSLGLAPGGRILDLCAGDGNVSVQAASLGASPVACDLSVVQLGRARARIADLPCVAGDATRLPMPDDSFDAVVSVFGAIVAPDADAAAAEAFRVCRPGGRVVFTSWPRDSFMGELIALVRAAAPDPSAFPDQDFGWGDPATAAARFAVHGDDVSVGRRTLAWDLAVRGSAGSDDYAAAYAAKHLPGLDLGDAQRDLLARHLGPDGQVRADYLLISAAAR